MSESSIVDQAKFWEILKYLTELKKPILLTQACQDLKLAKSELNSYFNFLTEIGSSIEIEASNEQDEKLIAFSGPAQFAIDQDFDSFSPLYSLENIIEDLEPSITGNLQPANKETLVFLEESLVDKLCVNMVYQNNNMRVFPRKIVYFDSSLNLVAEDIVDKTLVNINLAEIQTVFEAEGEYKPHYSQLEVDNFIRSMRLMNGNQVRLVLKIYARDRFSLNFDQKYFDNVCLFTNPHGDFIWAATLEPGKEVYEWLCELGSGVEILDPLNFKQDFIKYCEHKLKKLA